MNQYKRGQCSRDIESLNQRIAGEDSQEIWADIIYGAYP